MICWLVLINSLTFKILLSLNLMFKYQNFPLVFKEFFDENGVLKRKTFRMKSKNGPLPWRRAKRFTVP